MFSTKVASQLSMPGYRRLLAAVATVACTATPSAATQVDIPLRLDHAFIRQALLTQVYTAPNDQAVLWDTGTGCGYLKLREPNVSSAGNRLRVVTRGEARIGTPLGSGCLTALHWDGVIEVFEEPRVIAEERVLAFRVVQSNLYDSTWKKRLFTGKLWDLVKQYVHPRLEEVRVSLDEPVQEVRELLPTIVARGDAERIQAVLDSLQLRAATATDSGVTVTLGFTVNPTTPATGPTPEPTLAAEELRAWEEAWQRWDAFLTFTVKQLGSETAVQELRQALADVLIDGRFDILEALAPSVPGAPDPTRALFLKTWERLTPVVRSSATGQPGTVALRYLSFIAAGDALAALDRIGPDIGLEISADGLRRLARIVAPASSEDPLRYNTAIDPDLRQLFGFGAPLPEPDLTDVPGDEAWWRRLFAVRRAIAAEETPSAKTLQRWLPDRDTIDTYLDAIRAVLDAATTDAVATADLHQAERGVYRHLVRATAWQESCWRQFVRAEGKITYIKSPVGSTGMMQINEHVWRGFYDLRGLRWDIRYNARAGSEILLHYLQDYAIAHDEDAQPGGLDNLARATYAVYNGGPGHLTRYRKRNTKRSLRLIDRAFWEKYRAVATGREAEVTKCIIGE
jgi:transglycosylase-like protein with SLT domain